MNTEFDEIVRMLPGIDGPELSPMRQRRLKEHFLREAAGRPRARRRVRLAALLAPLGAAAAGLALVAAPLGGHRDSQRPVAYIPAPVVPVRAGTEKGVAETLDKIANAAAREPAIKIGPHQFTYTKGVDEGTEPEQQRTFDGPIRFVAPHTVESWLPYDPKDTGLNRQNGTDMDVHLARDEFDYSQIAALPTDPARLLNVLYKRQDDRDPERAFNQIGSLLNGRVLPPAFRAALYRATALIPGVRVVPDSADALGRNGIAVAFDADGERTEWVFDKTTFGYLGDRDYLLKDDSRAKAGTLLSASAVQAQTVVDDKGKG